MKVFYKITILIIGLTICSCKDYYFSEPQPIDTKNVTKVPKKLTGSWVINESNESDYEQIIVTKKYYKKVTRSKEKESRSDMELDSNIYFIKDKVYAIEDGSLVGGYNYTIQGDSIIIEMEHIEIVEFGQNAFLRKFDYGYILNLKHEEMNDWWKIKFIDTRNKEGIIVRNLKTRDLKLNDSYEILHEDHNRYLNASWSKKDLTDFIDKGGFSDTAVFLRFENRIEH